MSTVGTEAKAVSRRHRTYRAMAQTAALMAGIGVYGAARSVATAAVTAVLAYIAGVELASVLSRRRRALPLLCWLSAVAVFLACLAAEVVVLTTLQVRPGSLVLPLALASSGAAGWLAHRGLRHLACRRAPWLPFEDQIHATIIAPGRLTPAEVAIRLQWLRLRRASALIPAYRQALEQARRTPAVASAVYRALVEDLAEVEGLTADLRQVLGQAYLGLGELALQQNRPAEALARFLEAQRWIALPRAALQHLAGYYVERQDASEEAIHAYLAYLEARRQEPADQTAVACRNLLRSLVQIDEGASRSTAEGAAALARRIIGADPTTDWAHYYLGVSLYLLGEYGYAAEALERAAALNPSHAMSGVFLGRTRLERGEVAAALDAFRRALAADPACQPALYWLGRALVGEAETRADTALAQEAVALLQQAHGLAPAQAEVLYYLGRAHALTGANDEAARALEGAISLDASQAPYHYRLALVQEALGLPRAAMVSLERSLALDPQQAAAWQLLGDLSLAAGDYAHAEASYTQALALLPADAHAREGLGRSLFYQGRYVEAITQLTGASPLGREGLYALGRAQALTGDMVAACASYEQHLGRFGPDADVSYYLGCARAHRGDWPGALAALDQAATLAPERADILLQRGNVRLLQGELALAREDLTHARARAPESAAIAYALGVCLARLGDEGAATAELERAVELDPSHAAAHLGLGLALERRREHARAAEAYRQALAAGANPAQLHLRLGAVTARLGEAATALEHLLEARRLGVEGDELRYHLGFALATLGRHEEAIAEWEALLETHPDDRALALDIARSQYLLGCQHFEAGAYEQSIAAWGRCQDIWGDDPSLVAGLAEAWFRLGVESLARGEREMGRASLQRSLSLGQDAERVHYYLGLGALAAEEWGTALEELAPLAQAHPEGARYQYHLGLALLNAGRPEEAVPVLQQALAGEGSAEYALGAQLALAGAHVRAARWAEAAALYRAVLTGESPPRADRKAAARQTEPDEAAEDA